MASVTAVGSVGGAMGATAEGGRGHRLAQVAQQLGVDVSALQSAVQQARQNGQRGPAMAQSVASTLGLNADNVDAAFKSAGRPGGPEGGPWADQGISLRLGSALQGGDAPGAAGYSMATSRTSGGGAWNPMSIEGASSKVAEMLDVSNQQLQDAYNAAKQAGLGGRALVSDIADSLGKNQQDVRQALQSTRQSMFDPAKFSALA